MQRRAEGEISLSLPFVLVQMLLDMYLTCCGGDSLQDRDE